MAGGGIFDMGWRPYNTHNVVSAYVGPPPCTSPGFRSSVDVVRLAASVRDQKGRFVRDLTAAEFEVFDSGRMRTIKDFRPEVAGLSVALLFDVSGSMEGQLANARDAAETLLGML